MKIPDKDLVSTEKMAQYFVSNFHTQIDRARAIYKWITEEIYYDEKKLLDIENGTYYNTGDEKNLDAQQTLKTGKGVCYDYACLFTAIANESGLNSFVVTGYTRSNKAISDTIGHAWSAAEIDSRWYLFDPTWGAGYINNSGKYVHKVNDMFFMAGPEEFIKTHMPLDPLWQFLNYPVTRDEFQKGVDEIEKNKPFFSYRDTQRKAGI